MAKVIKQRIKLSGDEEMTLSEELRRLWQYRDLLVSIVQRDLKVRYKNSFFGFLWSLVQPLMTVAVISFIFKNRAGVGVESYSAYVLAAYLPFMFLSSSILDATGSILGNMGLMKKIYFPREILPIASIIGNFIHFLLALLVFFAYMLVVWALHPGVCPFQASTIYLPILLVITFLFSTGAGLLLSSINTFYEDVKYIVQFAMQMLFFLSWIMTMPEQTYAETPRRYLAMTILNPFGIICNGFRKILLAHAPTPVVLGPRHVTITLGIEWGAIAYAGAFSVVIFVVGYFVFNRYKWKFVERP